MKEYTNDTCTHENIPNNIFSVAYAYISLHMFCLP